MRPPAGGQRVNNSIATPSYEASETNALFFSPKYFVDFIMSTPLPSRLAQHLQVMHNLSHLTVLPLTMPPNCIFFFTGT